MKTILITGGCGFIGTNASAYYLKKGYKVIAFDNLSRVGAEENLKWLFSQRGTFVLEFADIRKPDIIYDILCAHEPDFILHLAAQVTMVTSITNPREDFEINALGTFNLLEAMRQAGSKAPAIYASTNKVMGELRDVPVTALDERYAYNNISGIDESFPLDFHGPYGCSKGCGDQYFLDYARVFGLNTVVFRQSGIYGPHQFGIEEQGWLAWFCNALLADHAVTIFGDGKQVRDVLYVDDLIRAYGGVYVNIGVARGNAYNIGGGPEYSLSIWELFHLLSELSGREFKYTFGPWRQGDQKIYISDLAKIKKELGWQPSVSPEDGVKRLYDWILANRSIIFGSGVFGGKV